MLLPLGSHNGLLPSGHYGGPQVNSKAIKLQAIINIRHEIIFQWDLVCADELGASNAHLIMVLGALLGTFIIAPFSDAFGRKPIFLLSLWILGIFGISNYFIPSYESFLAIQFFRGFFIPV